MGSSGLEPPTSCLSGMRSNRLSYEPIYPVVVFAQIIEWLFVGSSVRIFGAFACPSAISRERYDSVSLLCSQLVACLAVARHSPLLTVLQPRSSRHWRRSVSHPQNYKVQWILVVCGFLACRFAYHYRLSSAIDLGLCQDL